MDKIQNKIYGYNVYNVKVINILKHFSDVEESKQQNNNAVEKEQEANPTSDEKGKTL